MDLPILKKNRSSSGISDLDLILEGGYRSPANILFIGPANMEKTALAYHFASAPSEENSYIICGSASANDIIKKAASFGINLDKPNIRFIDCYSATLGKSVESSEKVMIVPGPTALNDISLMLNEAIKQSVNKKMRIVFDTLSTFVLYNQKDSIRKFLSVIEGRLKTANSTTIYLIDDGIHEKQLVSILEHGMDEKYVLSEKEGKTFLNVPGVDLSIPIKISPSGLIVV